MNINDLLIKEAMIMDLQATEKKAAIDEMVQKLYDVGRITDIDQFKDGILAREEQTSTGLGDGIAMPHAKNDAVKEATVLFAKSKQGVDYEALDGQPTYLFFMIAAPEGADDTHLQALAALSRQLVNQDFVEELNNAQTPDDVQAAFAQVEQDDDEEQEEQTDQSSAEKTESTDSADRPFIVAVTACPTGIAHTYMAEDSLKNQAKDMGIDIKVETNGSEGVKHRLTSDDIARASGVVIAADTNVEMNRFGGKPVVSRPVSDGIRRPEELINNALSGNASIYQSSEEQSSQSQSSSEGEKQSVGQKIYKDLMNGVSHMLPFVVAGGIMMALSFMIDQWMGVPQDALDQLGNYNQVADWFNQIGNAAFGFMLPVLAGFIAMSISDRPGLVTGFAAGAIAEQGGAGFIGALIGGFVGGYVVEFLRKILKGLPQSLDGIKTILFFPFFGLLITGFLMLLINVPMKVINDGLNSFLLNLSGANAALLGALLAGMMAIDLGGPFNKAAYVFGTGTIAATIAQGGSLVMAAVMSGGMVPPLAIFVATRLFKNKFTEQENQAGLTNVIMGASFVTEGAIPFTAADPLRAIPSFVVGSAITGGLVGAMGIRLMAPHGGIFVIALVSQPLWYILFVIIGAIIAGVMLGLLKKPIK
ncbi:fructose-specific phosphotransferase system enzyme II [Tetragenococcus halophilus subsp. halophilus]|uniref:PTS fructose transporter subunit IIC n=3 Tax=Tetragenococcus halophilus TaxID=51669 RepID=A0AB35HKW7_TETHA|nr:fructose-specific PTS transporter subunit EIIC [Tetragenococcus halophilus]MCF1684872.1 fructose-specific PTS transporter subunit EIIC [Tetragenococcus halophilus]MCO7027147.1 fructose-specific PTS transporter subunit EIIC [Tetragenococcus halophilus]MCO8284954.1 PTS sugar transporter subunit IIA [Tetragenococcus halophilus]MCO8287900.1 PTS sugar transporter subunit IIA [Tetragenococcus halophilus]MCO8290726.1 PTS sugar transporter subunit IIA [Tetragenococcus halophilus]